MVCLNLYAVRGMSLDRSENLIAKIAFGILLVVSLSPLLFVAIPAMVDYPNHLARMYILASAGTPAANPFYQTAWALYPNLAMDLVIPQMAQLTGVENATRLFLLLSEIVLVSGAMAIERAVKGRIQLSAAAALMFLYALPFTWGFLNFEFGLGVALWGIAFGILVFERSSTSRLVVNTIFVAVLFASHFFALGVYGLTLGILELWRAWEKKAFYGETAMRLVILAIPAAILLVVMKLTGGAVGGGENDWHFQFKALWPYIIMNGYSTVVSAVTTVLLIGFLYVAGKRGLLKIHPAGICLAAGFFALYLAIPVAASRHGFRRSADDRRGGADRARLLLAVVTKPAVEARGTRLRYRRDASEPGRRLQGLAVIPRGLCGHDPVLRQAQERFACPDRRQQGG